MEEKLYWVYNFALSYLSTKIKKTKDVDHTEFETIFGNLIKSQSQQHIDFFAEAIEDWLDFETTILTSYCFDENFEAKLINGRISLGYKSKEEYNSWKNDTLRYLVNEKRYLKYAAHVYDFLDSENQIVIPGKNEQAVNDNLHLYLHEKKKQLLLEDLKIDKFKFGKKSLDAHKVITGLTGYSKNRQIRYVFPMRELSLNKTPWLESVFYVANQSSKEGVGNTPLPFIYTKLDDLIKTYQSAMDNFDATEIAAMINHFSQHYTEKLTFNPFNLSFNMIENPFLKIGDYVLMPTTLFAMNNWFFSFSQRALHIYAGKDHIALRINSSQEMEKLLLSEFQNKGWQSQCITQEEANNIDGDIDLFVNDGKTQLLIQLKRTKMKLDLESNYYDSLVTDLKASGQLNAAVHSLQNNVISELKIMDDRHLWIVTTSFEGVLTDVDGCKKVNYFDLLWALRFANITSVDDLVGYISADRPFRENQKLLEIPL